MKIALVGYGKMGRIIERIALSRGHDIAVIIDKDNLEDFDSECFKSCDVAIEFSTPLSAIANIERCWSAGVPVVCGTTGWRDCLDEMRSRAQNEGHGLFWTSNFSIGVNLFFVLNKRLAELMSGALGSGYELTIKEIHHIHKLDAPSGTAVTLAEDINFARERIESVREGEVPGTHIVSYESGVDKITITHEAKSREGFALGAVLAAEFMVGKTGFYGMEELLF